MKTKMELLANYDFKSDMDCFRQGEIFYYPCDYSKCDNYLRILNGKEDELAFRIYGTEESSGLFYDNSYCSQECLCNAVKGGESIGIMIN